MVPPGSARRAPAARRALATAVAALLGAAAGIAPRPIAAQRADALPVGATVRVERFEPPGPRLVGTLVSADSAGVTLVRVGAGVDGAGRAADTVRVPRWNVARLDRRPASRSPGRAFARGAGRGALVGVAVGALATAAMYVHERRNPCGSCWISVTPLVAVATVPLTAVTALVGGAIGVAAGDRWERVRLR